MDELSFRVVREVPGERDDLLALAINLRLARAAYQAAAQEYPDDVILLNKAFGWKRARHGSVQLAARKHRQAPCPAFHQ
jgi:hypothetical protein